MKKTLNNNENITLKELVDDFILDLYEAQTLELSSEQIVEMIETGKYLDDKFAFEYALTQSTSDIVFIGKNTAGEMEIKSEFIVLAEDALKFDEFVDMINEGYSMKEIKEELGDISSTRKKVSVANKAQMQLELYYIAIDYSKIINSKIKSVKELYSIINK